jgi:microcystin-dependent protein
MSWKKVGSISRRPQFNYFHAPDATVDNVSVTQTIGGQLDLGEWDDASNNTRSLTIKNRIINVCDPSGPQDVATRAYVDRVINNSASGVNTGGGESLPGSQGPRGPAGVAGPSGPIGPSGPAGQRGIQGEIGPTGRDGSFVGKGDTGSAGPPGPTGNTGSAGPPGDRGPTGNIGPQGIQGSSGLLVYLNTQGDSSSDVGILDSFLMSTTNVNFNTSIMDFTIEAAQTKPLVYFWNSRSNITRAQTSIPGGEVWTLNLFAKPVTSADIQNVAFKFKVFRITSTTQALATSFILDTAGTTMPPVNLPSNVLSVGTVSTSTSLSTNGIALYQMALQVPFTDVSDPNTYLQVQIYATNLDPDRTHYCKLYFQNTNGGYTDPTTGLTYASTYSYLRTTFGAAGIQGAQGIQGDQGIQGVTGSRGATGSAGVQGIQGNTGSQGPAGIQGPRGDAVGPKRAVQYKHAITEVLDGTQYFLFDTSDNNGTLTVPNIVMQGSSKGSIITPHRIDVNNASDTGVAPLYLSAGAYGGTNYGTGFMTVGLKYDTATGAVTKPIASNEVNFGFQTTYGLQSVATGATALGPSGSYAYRLSRRNGGTAESAMEIMQNGTRFSLNSDRYLLSSSSGNSNGAPNTLMDLTAPVYDASTSFMLSTRVGVNAPGDAYPVWLSCHQGTSTYGNTGAMIKMNSDEIAFMGPVKFLKGMDTSGGTLNLNTDISGTINVGDRSSFINIGNGPQITAISIGSGGATSVPTTIDIGNGITTGTLNLGTGATIGGVVNIGTSANGGKSIINIGGVGDEVNVMGSVTYVNTTNLDVSDNLITLNKGATAGSSTIQGAGIQLSRLNNSSVETNPGWIKTEGTNAQSWEIVPPNHPVSVVDFPVHAGSGLAVCNVINASPNEKVIPVVGLRTTKASSNSIQNLILKPDGNVGIGYADAALASVPNFPSSLLHIESTAGNQITLGSGNDNSSVNYVRTFLSSPISGNSNVILAVGRNNNGLRVSSISSLSSGFRLAYTDSAVGSSSTLALACTNNDNASAFSTNLTFFRNDGTALFSSNLCIDNSKFFRMYRSTFSAASPTENVSFEINGADGTMRIGGGGSTVSDPSAGSLTLGSHLILSGATDVPNTANRPGVGKRGMLRFNNDNNSAEIFDGTKWADVGYYAGLPLGSIIAYPSETEPNSTFLNCNGASLSRATYNDLFNLIGTTYGFGTDTLGATTFALPDIRGRTIVGKGTGGTFTALNQTGGTETVTLDVNQIPSHDHSVGSVTVSGSGSVQTQVQSSGTFTGRTITTDFDRQGDAITDTTKPVGHSHGAGWAGGGLHSGNWKDVWDQRYFQPLAGFSDATPLQIYGSTHKHFFTASGDISVSSSAQSSLTLGSFTTQGTQTGVKGGGLSHNNLQPYIVLNYYIKAKKESKQYAAALVSDVRVKHNIKDMDSEQSMNAILSLQPKRYEYVDKTISEFEKHIGFIAQETKYCIPESVRTKREFIPNIYSMAKLVVYNQIETSSILLTSVQKPITSIITDELKEQVRESKQKQTQDGDNAYSLKGVKLKLFNRAKQPICVTCIESVDEYNILVENCNSQSTLKSDEYFVYGQEVEDYHYMNNDAIFSTLVSAFQELGKRVKQQDIFIKELKEQLNIRS